MLYCSFVVRFKYKRKEIYIITQVLRYLSRYIFKETKQREKKMKLQYKTHRNSTWTLEQNTIRYQSPQDDFILRYENNILALADFSDCIASDMKYVDYRNGETQFYGDTSSALLEQNYATLVV